MPGLGENLANQFKKAKDELFSISGVTATIKEVDKAAYDLAKTFGLGAQNVDAIRASLADAASGVYRLGGSWDDVLKMQSAVFSDLGRNVNLTAEGSQELFATTKATGQEASTLIDHFKNIGVGVYDIGENMETVVQAARDIGVNATAVSKQALDNMDMMNKYNFEGGVQGLAKMAAQAVNLRINVSDMKGIMDKAFEPDQAIQLAASMQRLGATQSDLLDPLRLMDLAQNDPAELMNQVGELGKQFVQFNEEAGKFEIAPGGKRQLMELAKEMGVPYETLTKMSLAGAELDDKLSKIKFPTDVADEDTQKMIANMAEMKDGQYVVKFKDEQGVTQEKNVTELKPEDIQAIAKAQEEAPKSMEDIAKSQLSTMESIDAELKSMNKAGYALAGGKASGDFMKTLRQGAEVAGGFARDVQGETMDMRKGMDKAIFDNLGAINKALSGEGSLEDVVKAATGSIGTAATTIKDNFNVAVDNATTKLTEMKESGNLFVEFLNNAGTAAIKYTEEHEKLNLTGKKTESVTTETSTLEVKDFYIKTLPEDKLVMAGGTNLDGQNNTQSMSPQELNVKVDLNVTAPPNVDTSQLMALFQNDVRIKDAIVKATQDAYTSGGITGTNNPISRGKSIVKNAFNMTDVA